MKCTAIKLTTRRGNSDRCSVTKDDTTYTSFPGGGRSYSFPFNQRKSIKPTLAITNIDLPEKVESFNTGSSLARWSRKRSRLKSDKISKIPTDSDTEFCYESVETEFSVLLERDRQSPDSLDNLEYEIHTDIEKLMQESQHGTNNDKKEQTSRKKSRKSREIKFSKSPSPETEQIIRVDVTSHASDVESGENDRAILTNHKHCMKSNLNENVEICDEDLIVRCSQLALLQRRRRL